MLAVDLRGSTALDAELKDVFGDQWQDRYYKIYYELRTMAETAVSQSSCIKESRGFMNGWEGKWFKKDSAKLLFHSPWRHFDVMGAIESALWLKDQWDTTSAIAKHADGKCKHHGLAIAINIESLPRDQALSDDIVNATKTFRLLAKVSETYPDPAISFLAITTECLDHLKSKTAISFLPATPISVGKHSTENIEMIHHLVEGDLDLASANASCSFYFVKHGLVEVNPYGLCRPVDPDVEVTLAQRLDLKELRAWIARSRNKIRILQTYIPMVESLSQDLFSALRRKVNIEVLLLQPHWTLKRVKEMLPIDLARTIGRRVEERPLPSFFAIQRNRELEPGSSEFTANIVSCRNTLQDIQKLHIKQGGNEGRLTVNYYDSLPGIALHIFDDIMFVGFFLQKKFAVETPQFVIARKGQALWIPTNLRSI